MDLLETLQRASFQYYLDKTITENGLVADSTLPAFLTVLPLLVLHCHAFQWLLIAVGSRT